MSINKYGVPVSDTNDDRYPTVQPKFKNRFRVFFYNFAHQGTSLDGLDGSSGVLHIDQDNIALMGNLVSFNKPQVTFTQTEVRSFVGRGNVSGRPTWENVNITLRDDVKNAVVGFVARQVYLQQQKYIPHSLGFGRNFTFSMMLEVMDGRVGHTGLERWLFSGCTINTANFGDLSYEMDTDIQKIDLSIMYNNIYVYSPNKVNLHNHHAYNENTTGKPGAVAGAVNDIVGGISDRIDSVFGQATSSLMGMVDRGIGVLGGAANNAISSGINRIGGLF